jgi:tRNA G10  N-methylase Trm11|eukprot:COSAG01_NODE_503_length_16167_cov_10.407230_5_plen_62_part_00
MGLLGTLLQLAARALKVGGRLVFWAPSDGVARTMGPADATSASGSRLLPGCLQELERCEQM